tara:strand:- start:41 stop:250 length:210 start_codon:yes stop_codon:yes gene_type:complete
MKNTYDELYKKYADEFEARNIANTHFPSYWDSDLKQYGNYKEDLANLRRDRKEYWVMRKIVAHSKKEKS